MNDTSEKYPVCLNRTTRAALRRFLQPLNFFALLKAGRAPRPAGILVPVKSIPTRGHDRRES
jgi:hypothetical protein